MEDILVGNLIHSEKFGWQVRYEYGIGQVKCLFIHTDSIEAVKEHGMEGEEVRFIMKGMIAKRSLNGAIVSAFILK
jgi:hypothetical protein